MCHSLARSSKHASVYDATQLPALAVTKQDLGDFCKTSMTRKAMEFSSTSFLFFFLQHIRTARNTTADATPSHLGVTSLAQLIQSGPAPGEQFVRHSLGYKYVCVDIRVFPSTGHTASSSELPQRLLKFKEGLNGCSAVSVLSLAMDTA